MKEHKDDLDSILDRIIEKSFEEIIEFLEKNGISTDKKPKLKIIESSYSIEIYDILGYPILYAPIPSIVKIALAFWEMWKYRRIWGLYGESTGTVYIMKSTLIRNINRLLNFLYKRRRIGENLSSKNTKGYSITGIRLSEYNNAIYPAYINWNDIKNSVAKIPVYLTVGHELSHAFISKSDLVASTSEYLIYFYINKLYEYPEAYKIIEVSIKQYKEYIEKGKKLDFYDLGGCLAAIIIDKNKNKKLEELNIKDIIEKTKYLSEEDVINEIKSYKI